MRTVKKLIIFLILFFAVTACVSTQPEHLIKNAELMYNKYNIHIQYKSSKNITAHFANWTGPFAGHRIIPPNTPIKILPWNRGFVLLRTDTNDEIKFIYSTKHMIMDKETYINTIFSPNRISLDDLSSLDKKGVKEGRAIIGMTKQGVMTALGYPAAHRTPSLDNKEWIYWTNRFGTKAVIFDENEKVIGLRE